MGQKMLTEQYLIYCYETSDWLTIMCKLNNMHPSFFENGDIKTNAWFKMYRVPK